jgi:acyl-protein synthetase LuxE
MQSIAKLSEFTGHLRHLIQATSNAETEWTEKSFGELASTLFELQCELNDPYRTLCFAAGHSNNLKPQDWKEIPAVPTSAFKDLELSCLPMIDRTTVFHSSGTTKHRPSRHFHSAESLLVYEDSLLAWFSRQIQIKQRLPTISLTPPPELAPNSSLVHMFKTMGRKFGTEHSVFLGRIGEEGGWSLDFETAFEAIRRCMEMQQPILILGTAFLYVHLLDNLTERNISLKLPVGTVAVETGGYKGRSRAVPKQELHQLIGERLGISEANIVCEYGMSELSSQAYDHVSNQYCSSRRKENPNSKNKQDAATELAKAEPLPIRWGEGSRVRGSVHWQAQTALSQKGQSRLPSAATQVFHFPPWARVQIISPETGREVNEGETGLIRVFDLANVFSVMAVQTEDLGIRRGDGFELVGRASLAEARGCSLMTA